MTGNWTWVSVSILTREQIFKTITCYHYLCHLSQQNQICAIKLTSSQHFYPNKLYYWCHSIFCIEQDNSVLLTTLSFNQIELPFMLIFNVTFHFHHNSIWWQYCVLYLNLNNNIWTAVTQFSFITLINNKSANVLLILWSPNTDQLLL